MYCIITPETVEPTRVIDVRLPKIGATVDFVLKIVSVVNSGLAISGRQTTYGGLRPTSRDSCSLCARPSKRNRPE